MGVANARPRPVAAPTDGTQSQVRRRVVLALAATLLALTATLAPARAPVARAASDVLELTTAATYTLAPARHVVRVTLDVTARNNKPNVTSAGTTTKYFYDGAEIAIQTEATNIRTTAGGIRLTATTKPKDGYSILDVRFRRSLFYHQSTSFRVTFDLPGGAPRSTSDIRVGTAFATFVAWAFGDSGSVRVVIPIGFEAEATGSAATKSTSGGATIFQATAIGDVGAWYLVVNADRKSALTNDRIDLSGGEHIVIRAWPEDAAWRKRVSELLTTGLPELVDQTGLDWPVAADLSVFEVHTPLLEGYGGVFLKAEDKIEVSEDLDDLTILHEASHAWFNNDLFDGRWINEGFADTYAAKALAGLGSGGWAPNDVSPTDKAAVRLVDWVHPGRITDAATNAREQYGYEASWTVIRSIVSRVGDVAMARVLNAAQHRQIAYVGAGEPETVSGASDWRRLLDLLDERGQSTTAADVFRRWVVTDAQAQQLDARAIARTAYAALVVAGAGWLAPFSVRGPMSDWSFPMATIRIAEASALLARRDAIVATAATLGVKPPDALQTSYEAARDSLDDANHVADTEAAALQALATATSAVGAPRALLVELGLLGTTPESGLAAARSAFSVDAVDAAVRAAAVTALIDGASHVGRGRLVGAIAVLVAVLVLLVVLILVIRRRGLRRRAPALPYATLADQSSRPLDADPTPADAAEPPPADRGDES